MSSWPKTTLLPILTALGISLVAGTLCKLLHIPLPWMLGPLFGVGLAAINGVKVGEIRGGRQAGQLIIGCALGLYFTPEVTRYLLGFWPYMLFASFASIGIGAISGYLQTRISGITYVTGYFASVPGGASVAPCACGNIRSTPTTSCPSATSRRPTAPPMKPAEPVSRILTARRR